MATPTTVQVILSSTDKWPDWIEAIRKTAESKHIWNYVDPDKILTPEQQVPTPVAKPAGHDTPEGPSQWNMMTYRYDRKAYDDKIESLAKLDLKIFETITETYRGYVHKDTVYQNLVNLKVHVALNLSARKLSLRNEYQQLIKGPKGNKIVDWLSRYERVYADMKKLDMPDVLGDNPLWDFVNAAERIDTSWATGIRLQLTFAADANKPFERDIPSLIQNLQTFKRSLHVANGKSYTSSVFQATFQGRTPRSTSPTCLCGSKHWYSECYYLNDESRPSNWTPNTEVQQKVQQALQKSPSLQDKVNKSINKGRVFQAKNTGTPAPSGTQTAELDAQKLQASTNASAFTAIFSANHIKKVGTTYELQDSFILDSGATIHVCNNIKRFTHIRPGTGSVMAGDTVLDIQAWGNVNINVNTPYGRRIVPLLDVAYIPSFHTSLISLKKALYKGFHWNTRTMDITNGTSVIMKVEVRFDQFVVEYNHLQGAFGTTKIDASKLDVVIQSEATPYPTDQSEVTKTDDVSLSHASAYMIRPSFRPRISNSAPASIWHQRLGHPGPDTLIHFNPELTGVKLIDGPTTVECEPCIRGKHTDTISRIPRQEQATKAFQRIHVDLVVFSEEDESFDGRRYHFHATCEASLMNLQWNLRRKSDIRQALRRLVAYVHRQYGCTVEVIQTDNETSLDKEFKDWCSDLGIRFEPCPTYSPSSNGRSERSGGVIMTMARVMRLQSRLPTNLWSEIVLAAGYILNRTPKSSLGWKSPLEVLYELIERPNPPIEIAHLRAYGCRCYPLIHKEETTHKLNPRAHLGYLVGYDATNIFRVWIPGKTPRQVIRSRSVRFDEQLFFDPLHRDFAVELREKADEIYDCITVDTGHDVFDLDSESETSESDTDDELTSVTPTTIESSSTTNTTCESSTSPSRSEKSSSSNQNVYPTPSSGQSARSSVEPTPSSSSNTAEHTPEPTSSESTSEPASEQPTAPQASGPRRSGRSTDRPDNYYESKPSRRPPRGGAHFLQEFPYPSAAGQAFFAGRQVGKQAQGRRIHRDEMKPAPTSWEQMLKHAHSAGFIQAAQKEFSDLERRGTWKAVPWPTSAAVVVIPVMWVFTYKFDTDGYLITHKARLVVRGDLHTSIHEDTYAATLALRSFRSVASITGTYDLVAIQLDAISAFTNTDLDEVIFIRFPPGFGSPGMCLLLLKALYGLVRSPLLWQNDFSSQLVKWGLKQVKEEPCLFINDWLVVFFYVDDIIVLCHQSQLARMYAFKQQLTERYEMRDLGDLSWFLGIRVLRDRPNRKLWLCQDSYFEKVATTYGLTDRPTVLTPLATTPLPPCSAETSTSQLRHLYSQRLGSLMYGTCATRPDTAFAQTYLGRFCKHPSNDHLAAVERALTYAYQTRDLAIEFSSPEEPTTEACRISSDASFGDDLETRRSTEGMLITLFGGAIDWRARRQPTVSTSTTEAELLALSHCASDVQWWKRFFHAIRFDPDEELSVACDNKQTIRLLCNNEPRLVTKLRHIDIHHHWLREQVQNEKIKIRWECTSDMPADGCTKSLSAAEHRKFVEKCGLRSIKHLLIVP